MIATTGTFLACKAIGAGIGAVAWVIIMPPETWGQFFTRIGISAISGFIFAHKIVDYLEWSHTDEDVVAAAFIAAFGAVPALITLVRLIHRWEPPKGD